MPLTERKEVGRANASDLVEVRTAILDIANAQRAKLFASGTVMRFNENILASSLQFTITDNFTGETRTVSTTSRDFSGLITPEGGTLYVGNVCAIVTNLFTQEFKIVDCAEGDKISPGLFAISFAGRNDCVRISNSKFFKCGGESGFTAILIFLRPFRSELINSFGSKIRIWQPYDITVVATGFELSNFAQDQGEPEEQIACVVTDTTSEGLYGERPSQSEEQSDFIETQVQACRVGENIIWQQNQVLEINFSIPFRPAIRRGQTIRYIDSTKGIDFLGIVKSFSHGFNFEGATVITQITARAAEYIFKTTTGLANPDDKIDLRA